MCQYQSNAIFTVFKRMFKLLNKCDTEYWHGCVLAVGMEMDPEDATDTHLNTHCSPLPRWTARSP